MIASPTMMEAPAAEDDDSISLTSSVEEETDPEKEWFVNDVLAQHTDDEGTLYLIDWQDYPLWNASWEPKANLSEGLLEQWREAKRAPGFQDRMVEMIASWKQAVLQHLDDRLNRRRRRNKKRAALGLEITPNIDELHEDALEYLDTIPRGDKEDLEIDDPSPFQPPVSSPEPSEGLAPPTEELDSPAEIQPSSSSSKKEAFTNVEASTRAAVASAQASPRKAITNVETPTRKATKKVKTSTREAEKRTDKSKGSVIDGRKRPEPTTPQSSSRSALPKTTQKPTVSTTLASKLNTRKAPNSAKTTQIFTALKTRHGDASLSNVFIGGKTRKPRRGLLDASKDPTVRPQFLRPRKQWLLEKGARDREGVEVPKQRPSEVFVLNAAERRQESQTQTGNSLGGSNIQQRQVQSTSAQNGGSRGPEKSSSNAAKATPVRQGIQKPSNEASQSPNGAEASGSKKKQRKTVRWDDEVTTQEPTERESSLFVNDVNDQPPSASSPNLKSESMEMEIDEPLSIRPSPQSAASSQMTRLPSEMSRASLNGDHEQSGSQNVTKTVKLGSGTSQSLRLTFAGIPRRAHQSWVAIFEDEEVLDFGRICTAKDFWAQDSRNDLKTTYGALQAEQLCRGAVVSDVDKGKVENVAQNLRLGSYGLLCYNTEFCIVLRPGGCDEWEPAGRSELKLSATLQYFVFQPSSIFQPSLLAPIEEPFVQSTKDILPRARPSLALKLLGLDYNQLIPVSLQNTTKHEIFLAFPESRSHEASFLFEWLRKCNPDCKILSSLVASHWYHFMQKCRGIIIIHEEATGLVRLFPGLATILWGGDATVWVFSKNLSSITQFTSNEGSSTGVGQISLHPVFPAGSTYGLAILLTPSFLVSQPQQAYIIVKWFAQKYGSGGLYRRAVLAVSADLCEWLMDLTMEKAQQRQRYAAPADQLLSEDSLVSRHKTWALLQDLVSLGLDLSVGYKSETSSLLVTAPEMIDSNDEPSLVNWFGWWSLTNMDLFRKFVVVGTSQKTDPARLWRNIKIPRYFASTTGNPDEELDGPATTQARKQPQMSTEPRLELIADDRGQSLINYLKDLIEKLQKQPSKTTLSLLYKFPVSFWTPDMPFHFRENLQMEHGFRPYLECLRWFMPFGKFSQRAMFFYTIEVAWEAEAFPQDVKPKRRPWFAIHRPCDLDIHPWQTTELLIWDMAVRGNVNPSSVYVDNLIPAQQELISRLQEEGKRGNLGLPLKRVWLGGFNVPETGLTAPLDVTLKTFELMLLNPNDMTPPPAPRLPMAGWRPVHRKSGVGKRPEPMAEPMDIDEPEDQDVMDLKMVFHPPRGHGERQRSKCTNRLYAKTQEALTNGSRDEMKFYFRPTMEWYREQFREGRGFEHVKITDWETFLTDHNIPDPEARGSESARERDHGNKRSNDQCE